jgi:hypothetical protein
MRPVVCINISFLYIRQHNNQINNLPPHLCQLSLFEIIGDHQCGFRRNRSITDQTVICRPIDK